MVSKSTNTTFILTRETQEDLNARDKSISLIEKSKTEIPTIATKSKDIEVGQQTSDNNSLGTTEQHKYLKNLPQQDISIEKMEMSLSKINFGNDDFNEEYENQFIKGNTLIDMLKEKDMNGNRSDRLFTDRDRGPLSSRELSTDNLFRVATDTSILTPISILNHNINLQKRYDQNERPVPTFNTTFNDKEKALPCLNMNQSYDKKKSVPGLELKNTNNESKPPLISDRRHYAMPVKVDDKENYGAKMNKMLIPYQTYNTSDDTTCSVTMEKEIMKLKTPDQMGSAKKPATSVL